MYACMHTRIHAGKKKCSGQCVGVGRMHGVLLKKKKVIRTNHVVRDGLVRYICSKKKEKEKKSTSQRVGDGSVGVGTVVEMHTVCVCVCVCVCRAAHMFPT